MELCSRCHKRLPVVYITKFENGKMQNEGLCIKCAREMGISQVDQVIEQLGLSEEDIERMNTEIDPNSELLSIEDLDENSEDGKAPPVDLKKIFGATMMGPMGQPGNDKSKDTRGESSKDDKKKKTPKKKFLDMYCQDLTKKAASGTIDRVIGRDREIARLIQILCRRQKNNPCLIGEPGVGKTAIAEALAQRIVDGNIPYKLAGKEVHLLDLTALVAGTQFRGQFETRMKGLIDEVKSLGNIILVIDEVHSIASAGDAEGSMNAANILKPALSRGEIQVIGATTLSEYRKYIEKDAALERRFQPITVEEPSIEDTVEVLNGIKQYYEQFHGLQIPNSIIRRAVILSERYITDRFLPDKAIDLLDEAASYRALSSPVIGELEQTRNELNAAAAERESLEAPVSGTDTDEKDMENKYHRIADLKVKEIQLTEREKELSEKQKNIILTTDDLAHVIEVWTGIPASNITENEFQKIDRLEENLKKHIIGQDEAVNLVARAIKRNRAGVSYKRKPVSFIFAGSTGVGKTELVKRLSSELFDSPETLIRLDMSEFMEKHSVSRIIGAPPGYVGYDEAGQLTEKIRRKPYSVILFDEIEKAHPDVMNVLLQILDDGHITDAHGKKVNFENTVIVMTTNAGSSFKTNTAGFSGSGSEVDNDHTMKALNQFLRPEFINRVDEIITFRTLSNEDFAKIAHLMLDELKTALSEKDITLSYTDAAAQFIADKSYSSKFGARNMRRLIQREVEDKIAEKIISDYNKDISAISIDCSNNNLIIGCV